MRTDRSGPAANWNGSGRAEAAPDLVSLLLFLTSAALFCLLAVLVVRQVHLYADGSHYLLWILSRGEELNDYPPRYFANLATQFPTVLAARHGVTSVDALSRLFGSTLVLHYALSLLACLAVVRHERKLLLFPLASMLGGGINASFFIVSESHLLASLFWPLALLLVLHRSWTWQTLALASILTLPTLRAYESMVVLGPMLAALAGRRVALSSNPWDRVASLTLAAWFLGGTAVAALELLDPREPIELDRFARSSLFFVDWRNNIHHMALASALSLGVILVLLLRRGRDSPWLDLAVAVSCLLPLATALTLVIWPESLVPLLHYKARVLNVLLPPALFVAMLLVRANGAGIGPSAWARASLVLLFLATGQLVWNVIAADYWSSYLRLFQGEVASRAGLVPFTDTALARQLVDGRPALTLNWGWTLPTMSILLAPAGEVTAIVANPIGWVAWQPFDPADPAKLPRLARFGIGYDRYAAALASRTQSAPPSIADRP